MWIWMLTVALAGDPVLEAWHHVDRRRFDDATRIAAAWLEDHPTELEAHRVHIHAATLADYRARAQMRTLYQAWHEANPDDPVARFAYAQALQAATNGDACDEGLPLLDPLPEAPADRYSALRIQQQWSRCEGLEALDIEAQLKALGPDAGAAGDSYKFWLAARDGEWDTVAAGLDALIADYPARVSSLGGMAFHDDPERAAPKALQDRLLDWAKGYADTDDPVALSSMVSILRAADHGKHKAAQKHQDAVDPGNPGRSSERSKVLEKVLEANKRPTHELALAALREVEPKVKEGSEERETWRYYMATRLDAVGDQDGLFAIAAEEARANPDDAQAVNAWAYECAVRGVQLDEAEAAMARVLPTLDTARAPEGWSMDSWVETRQWAHAAFGDTHGWLLHLLGRDEEAAKVLVKAAQLDSDPTIAAHTGLVLHALGQSEDAWPYLVHGAAPGGTGEEALDAAVHEALVALWPEHRVWHPGGMDGWLAAHHEALAPDEDEGDDGEAPAITSDHPLLGKAFPYQTADKLGGGTLDLTDHEGVLVVDMWATWCGPCVQGMPHLQEVAEAYADRGVRVVGLSVDQQVAPVTKFFKEVDPDTIGYDLGHVGGDGMATVQVNGIPALFVIDEDGAIAAYIRGYGPGDTRLERTLDKILAE